MFKIHYTIDYRIDNRYSVEYSIINDYTLIIPIVEFNN